MSPRLPVRLYPSRLSRYGKAFISGLAAAMATAAIGLGAPPAHAADPTDSPAAAPTEESSAPTPMATAGPSTEPTAPPSPDPTANSTEPPPPDESLASTQAQETGVPVEVASETTETMQVMANPDG